MTEKDKIKSEIERLLNKEWKWGSSIEAKFRCEAYKELLEFIDSIPKETVSEDLEKEIDRFLDNGMALRLDWRQCNITFNANQLIKFANYIANWKEQQMMKDAIDTKVLPANLEETEFCLDDNNEVERITQMVKENSLRIGDKVKLIIIKED